MFIASRHDLLRMIRFLDPWVSFLLFMEKVNWQIVLFLKGEVLTDAFILKSDLLDFRYYCVLIWPHDAARSGTVYAVLRGRGGPFSPPDSTWEKWPQCWQLNSPNTFLFSFRFTLTTRWEPNEWSCFLPCWNSTSVRHWSKSKLNILNMFLVSSVSDDLKCF